MSEQLQQTEPLGLLDEEAINGLVREIARPGLMMDCPQLRIALRTFLVRARQNYSQG